MVYYWKEFCISKWVGLDNQHSYKLQQFIDLYLGGLIIGRIFASEIWRAYCRGGIIGILPYYKNCKQTVRSNSQYVDFIERYIVRLVKQT